MSKGFNKRLKNLLPEYKNQFKSNKFNDKRIGENDTKISLEEKMFKRFAKERQRNKEKVDKYNLSNDISNEEVELTHFGQNLAQIEKNDMIKMESDEDSEEESGNINAQIVSENFFGGLNNENPANKKNRKEWIEEMIAKSKELKFLKQREKEKTIDLTSELDNSWKELQKEISVFSRKNQRNIEAERSQKDIEYDTLVQTLRFDLKAQATEKMKTVEEIESEKLKKFQESEKELAQRMNINDTKLETDNMPKLKTVEIYHRSADDMDFDDYELLKQSKSKEDLNGTQNDEKVVEDIEEKHELDKDFSNERWIKDLHDVCDYLSNNKINSDDFNKKTKLIIQKLNPALDENNKKRLFILYQRLIDLYKTNCLEKHFIDFTKLDCLSKIIFQLSSVYFKVETSEIFFNVIKEAHNEMNNYTTTYIPNLDMCNIATIVDCFKGLLLANLCYEFTWRSKRYMAECMNFLNSCLYLAIDKNTYRKSILEFQDSIILRTFKLARFDLIPCKKMKELNKLDLSFINRYDEESSDMDSIKISLLNFSIHLIESFAKLYSSNVCCKEIFCITINLIDLLPLDIYPHELQEKISQLKAYIVETSNQSKMPLQLLNNKPLRLKLLEPKVEARTKFDPRHHNTLISQKQLQVKRYKKEYKTAVKEIRKDNQFLANVQFKEQLQKDRKRNKKVKEIMNHLSVQEGEYKKSKKLKT